MTHAALLASLLTAVVSPIAPAAGPAVPTAVPERIEAKPPVLTPAPVATAPEHSPLPQIGLGALQVAASYLAGIAPFWLANAGVHPPGLGNSEDAGVVILGLLGPTMASAAVWGTGHLSSRYRGNWWRTLLGAYVGAAVGLVVGRLLEPVIAPAFGVDTNPDVPTDTFSMAIGAVACMPLGAVVGWHLSKREVAPSAVRQESVLPVMSMAQPSLSLMLPVINLRW
jgi:uncharacterized membrane protein YeaQ/YmgE (transglycosylase-associated protein family)